MYNENCDLTIVTRSYVNTTFMRGLHSFIYLVLHSVLRIICTLPTEWNIGTDYSIYCLISN